jgi:hypothetical protein
MPRFPWPLPRSGNHPWLLALTALTACGGRVRSAAPLETGGSAAGGAASASSGGARASGGDGGGEARSGGNPGGSRPASTGGVSAGTAGFSGAVGADGAMPGVGAAGGSAGTGGVPAALLGGAGGHAGGGAAEAGEGGRSFAELGGSAGSGGTGGSIPLGAAGGAGQPSTCEQQAAALEQLIPDALACTLVVRLDTTDVEILAYTLVCGDPRLDATEDEARTTASIDSGFDFTAAPQTAEPDRDQLYVFELPSNDFGAVGVVSVYTGLTVFAGGIVWAGTGEIEFPSGWSLATELGSCAPPDLVPTPSVVGPATATFAPMDPTLRVWSTALPRALSLQDASLLNVAVMLYPRTVGAFDPTTSEYIVFVNWDWV